jgi:hypothetical protein
MMQRLFLDDRGQSGSLKAHALGNGGKNVDGQLTDHFVSKIVPTEIREDLFSRSILKGMSDNTSARFHREPSPDSKLTQHPRRQ